RTSDLDLMTCQVAPDAFVELFHPSLIARLHQLAIHVRDESIPFARLVRSAGGPHKLRHLRLTIGNNHETPRQLINSGVLDAPLFQELTALDVSDNLLGADGVADLVSSPIAEGLRSLSLNWTRITAEDVAILASTPPALTGLRRLEL